MNFLIVMRHSKRVDSIENGRWDDMDKRPYDTPISCKNLPVEQGKKLIEYGITKVVCSPFRRCLETAALVCREIGVTEVIVDKGFGESMSAVRRINDRRLPPGSPDSAYCLQYLSKEESEFTLRGLNSDLSISDVLGEKPSYTEDHEEGYQRYIATVERYLNSIESESDHGSVLVVSHGDTVASIGEQLCNYDVYSVNECGFLVLKPHCNCDCSCDCDSNVDGDDSGYQAGSGGAAKGRSSGYQAGSGGAAKGRSRCLLHTADSVYIMDDPLGANPTTENTFCRSRVPSRAPEV